ncbi:MAG: hypothetical protein QNJ54_09995 [Prochloraceae cyanobacterium]|nr:hypothetical protein [Prochloraceae cyanobacterium]
MLIFWHTYDRYFVNIFWALAIETASTLGTRRGKICVWSQSSHKINNPRFLRNEDIKLRSQPCYILG